MVASVDPRDRRPVAVRCFRALKLGNYTYNFGIWRRRESPVEQYQQLISTLATTPLEGE